MGNWTVKGSVTKIKSF